MARFAPNKTTLQVGQVPLIWLAKAHDDLLEQALENCNAYGVLRDDQSELALCDNLEKLHAQLLIAGQFDASKLASRCLTLLIETPTGVDENSLPQLIEEVLSILRAYLPLVRHGFASLNYLLTPTITSIDELINPKTTQVVNPQDCIPVDWVQAEQENLLGLAFLIHDNFESVVVDYFSQQQTPEAYTELHQLLMQLRNATVSRGYLGIWVAALAMLEGVNDGYFESVEEIAGVFGQLTALVNDIARREWPEFDVAAQKLLLSMLERVQTISHANIHARALSKVFGEGHDYSGVSRERPSHLSESERALGIAFELKIDIAHLKYVLSDDESVIDAHHRLALERMISDLSHLGLDEAVTLVEVLAKESMSSESIDTQWAWMVRLSEIEYQIDEYIHFKLNQYPPASIPTDGFEQLFSGLIHSIGKLKLVLCDFAESQHISLDDIAKAQARLNKMKGVLMFVGLYDEGKACDVISNALNYGSNTDNIRNGVATLNQTVVALEFSIEDAFKLLGCPQYNYLQKPLSELSQWLEGQNRELSMVTESVLSGTELVDILNAPVDIALDIEILPLLVVIQSRFSELVRESQSLIVDDALLGSVGSLKKSLSSSLSESSYALLEGVERLLMNGYHHDIVLPPELLEEARQALELVGASLGMKGYRIDSALPDVVTAKLKAAAHALSQGETDTNRVLEQAQASILHSTFAKEAKSSLELISNYVATRFSHPDDEKILQLLETKVSQLIEATGHAKYPILLRLLNYLERFINELNEGTPLVENLFDSANMIIGQCLILIDAFEQAYPVDVSVVDLLVAQFEAALDQAKATQYPADLNEIAHVSMSDVPQKVDASFIRHAENDVRQTLNAHAPQWLNWLNSEEASAAEEPDWLRTGQHQSPKDSTDKPEKEKSSEPISRVSYEPLNLVSPKVTQAELVQVLNRWAQQISVLENKQVVFEISPKLATLPVAVLSQLLGVIEPVLHNIVVHSIENKFEREKAGKSSVGRIKLQVDLKHGDFVLLISDDGCGFDVKTIERAASQLNLLPSGKLTQSRMLQFVFHPAMANNLSQTLPLADAATSIKRAGGAIVLEKSLSGGAQFVLHLPLKQTIERFVVLEVHGWKYGVKGEQVVGQQRVDFLTMQRLLSVSPPRLDYEGLSYSFVHLPSHPNSKEGQISLKSGQSYDVIFVRGVNRNIALYAERITPPVELSAAMVQLNSWINGVVESNGESAWILDIQADFFEQQSTNLPSTFNSQQFAIKSTLLLVDDEFTSRDYLRQLFLSAGFNVIEAFNAYDALSVLDKHHVDVVLTKTLLEGENSKGLLLLKSVKEKMPKAVTSIMAEPNQTGHARHAGLIGVDVYLEKPITDQELVELILDACGNDEMELL